MQAQSVLKDFSGRQASQQTIYLEWTTKAGNTCADLRIERSFENGEFEEVYQYNGICGETDKDQDYSYVDTIMKGGKYGYRINENNGDYSDTLFVQAFTDGAAVVVYPNPARDFIYLRFSDNNVVRGDIELIDELGKLHISLQNTDLKEGIRVSEIPRGIYTLLLYPISTSVIRMKFVRVN
jgi:hypothetical protein